MKRFFGFLIIAISTLYFQDVVALVVENSAESNAPFHVRVFNSETDFKNWLIGRGVAQIAVDLLTQFSKTDLKQLKSKGSTTLERNINSMIDKISKGQVLLKAQLSQQLLDSHLGKRGVDLAFQLGFKHLDPKNTFEKGFSGKPAGVYLVITPHGSKVPLWSDQVLESDKYKVVLKKSKDIAGKEDRYKIDVQYTGYGIISK